MDALTEDTGLQLKVEGAQSALARAHAKANLMGDPLGPALEAMSDSLGAQLALHLANMGHFKDVTDRLNLSVSETIRHGEQALDTKRAAIVEALAPELAKQTARSVRSWNRAVTLRTAISYGAIAVALAFGVGMAGYGVGWQAGRNFARVESGALAGALRQGGDNSESALVSMVRANNMPEAWAQCLESATVGRQGRAVCLMPMWVEPEEQPTKG